MTAPLVHNIDPVITQAGDLYLWWYGSSYSFGFIGFFLWLRVVRGSLGMDMRQVYDLTILVASGVLIGGRAVEVIFYEWAYYGTHPWHIFCIWLGGMSTHGILFGGTFGAWLFCRLYQKSFLSLADELAIPAALIMGFGRLGNFIDGQIVGGVTDVWWAIKFPDAGGFRHPVVLYDGLKNLLLIPILLFIRRFNLSRGVLLGTFLFGYGFFRIFIDYFREYRMELLGLPPGQEFNIGMSVVGMVLIVWAIKRQHIQGEPLTSPVEAGRSTMELARGMQIRSFVLLALLLLPLVIPSDWTQDVPHRYGKRHEGMTHSALYPAIITSFNIEAHEAQPSTGE